MIKNHVSILREYFQNLTTKEMSAEELQKHQDMLKEFDEIDKEADQKDAEISSCKDQIVSLVKSQGTSEVPKEERKPRTLEEIANDTLNGGK